MVFLCLSPISVPSFSFSNNSSCFLIYPFTFLVLDSEVCLTLSHSPILPVSVILSAMNNSPPTPHPPPLCFCKASGKCWFCSLCAHFSSSYGFLFLFPLHTVFLPSIPSKDWISKEWEQLSDILFLFLSLSVKLRNLRRILLIVPLRQHFQLEGCACVCLCRFQHLQTVSLSIALFDLWVNLMGPPLRLKIVALYSPMLMVQTENFCSCCL